MRRTCLVLMSMFAGCFSEPPSSGTSGSSSGTTGGAAGSGSASATADSGESTSATDTGSTSFGSLSTGLLESSGTLGSSSSGSTGGDVPEEPFCGAPANASAIACTDFDAQTKNEWPQVPPVGYTRTVEGEPAPFSAPRFMRLASTSAAPQDASAQALFEAQALELGDDVALRLRLAFRLPPDFVAVCDGVPVQLFSFEYPADVDMGEVRITGLVSDDVFQLVFTDAQGQISALYEGGNIHKALESGWRTLEVFVGAGAAGGTTTVSVVGSLGETGMIFVEAFQPLGELYATVGPWFEPGQQPPNGCNYDVDNIVLSSSRP